MGMMHIPEVNRLHLWQFMFFALSDTPTKAVELACFCESDHPIPCCRKIVAKIPERHWIAQTAESETRVAHKIDGKS